MATLERAWAVCARLDEMAEADAGRSLGMAVALSAPTRGPRAFVRCAGTDDEGHRCRLDEDHADDEHTWWAHVAGRMRYLRWPVERRARARG